MQPFWYPINEFLELMKILENEIETDVKIQTICGNLIIVEKRKRNERNF